MIEWAGYVEGLSEAVEFREVGKSPLTYRRSNQVQRFVLCDTSVTDPPKKGDRYFAEIERWRIWSKRGGRLKKPKLEEIIPGVDDNCIVAFLDYTDTGDRTFYLNYMQTRQGFRGKGYARRIIEAFYRRHAKARMIHWGKMQREEVGHLLDVMKEQYPKISSIGAVNY